MKSGKLKLELEDAAQRGLWVRSWGAAAQGANLSTKVLLDALLLLPASSAAALPAKDLALALAHLVSSSTLASLSSSSSLVVLEKAADAVDSRLRSDDGVVFDAAEVQELSQIVADLQQKFVKAITGLLVGSGASDPQILARAPPLLGRIATALPGFVRALKTSPTASGGSMAAAGAGEASFGGGGRVHVREGGVSVDEQQQQQLPPWCGWQKPTVGWLTKGLWLEAPQLQRRYENVGEYVETLQRLMALLAFYWGAGAVWPKCRHRQGGGAGGGGAAGK